VSILFFIVNTANSLHFNIQAEVEKVPDIKNCLLRTVETPCTTALLMEEDYFLM